jgi:hypothetical protein
MTPRGDNWTFTSVRTGWCLTVVEGAVGNDIPVTQARCSTGSIFQQFVLSAARGTVTIRGADSQRCLTVLSNMSTEGTPIVFSPCDSSASQLFDVK